MYVVPPQFVLASASTQVSTPIDGDPMWALERFEQSTHPGVWQFIDKSRIIQEIQDRLRDPSIVYRGGMLLSGAAAIAFEFLRKHPFRYVCLCHSLFETGGFQTRHRRVQVSEHVRQTRISDYWAEHLPTQSLELIPLMSVLDWMLLTTFHETQLSAFPAPSFMPLMPQSICQHPQLAKPWELKGWLKEVLGYQQVRYHHAHFRIALRSTKRLWKYAANVIAKGGGAIALVTVAPALNASLFEQPSVADSFEDSKTNQPNQWFCLTSHMKNGQIPGADRFETVWGILIAK